MEGGGKKLADSLWILHWLELGPFLSGWVGLSLMFKYILNTRAARPRIDKKINIIARHEFLTPSSGLTILIDFWNYVYRFTLPT